MKNLKTGNQETAYDCTVTQRRKDEINIDLKLK